MIRLVLSNSLELLLLGKYVSQRNLDRVLSKIRRASMDACG